MRQKILQITLAIIIIFGFFWLYKIIFLDTPKIEKNPYSFNNIPSQTFLIQSSNDTVITSQSGSILIFHKNSFVDNNGTLINGLIEIEFKEILDKADIIFSGLTTTSNGKILESGGMIYINANSNGQTVELSDSGKIGFAIQTDSIMPEMQIFKGQLQQDNMNWISPAPLLNDTVIRIVQRFQWDQDRFTKDDAIELGILVVDTLTGDRIFDDFKVVEEDLPELDAALLEQFGEETESSFLVDTIGVNMYREDINQKYVFELYDLGWANIDRLYYDKRTAPVDLITKVINYQDFGVVYITMVFSNQNIFLPGYQKLDKSYSFTHGDFEDTKLPIGEDAIIIATSSKKGIPYIDIKPITIKEKQEIQLSLKETSKDKLRKMIEENI
jgi:hypothetical protein